MTNENEDNMDKTTTKPSSLSDVAAAKQMAIDAAVATASVTA